MLFNFHKRNLLTSFFKFFDCSDYFLNNLILRFFHLVIYQDKMLPPARPAQPLPPAFQQPPQTIPSTLQVHLNISFVSCTFFLLC